LQNNPNAKVITNSAVGNIIAKENIPFTIVEHEGTFDFSGIMIRGFGEKHAPILDIIPPVQNTGYTIGETFYYPGDAFYVPPMKIELLALPVCGPWMHIREAIEFAQKVNPKKCFPVHDGMLKIFGPFHMIPVRGLEKSGIEFVPMLEGDSHDFS
jgi:L-ascorbate metabolism protein UlaG (beta-lactamase superfamily)